MKYEIQDLENLDGVSEIYPCVWPKEAKWAKETCDLIRVVSEIISNINCIWKPRGRLQFGAMDSFPYEHAADQIGITKMTLWKSRKKSWVKLELYLIEGKTLTLITHAYHAGTRSFRKTKNLFSSSIFMHRCCGRVLR